jgi:hypothetical protein
VSVSDAVYLLKYAQGLAEEPGCLEAADVNDDGAVDFDDYADLSFFARHRFRVPCAPFPEPGVDDAADGIGCERYEPSEPLHDPDAAIDVRAGEVGEDGTVPLTIEISSSRPIQGFELVLSFSGTRLFPGGYRSLIDGVKELVSGGSGGDGERVSMAFIYNIADVRTAGGSFVRGGGLATGASLAVLEFHACLAEATAAGSYAIEVERAELVDAETNRAILATAAAEPIVVAADFGPGRGCVDHAPSEVVTFCDEEPPVNLAEFVRGDANSDGRLSLADAMTIGLFLFTGGEPSSCQESADLDSDGAVDMSDFAFSVAAIFGKGPLPDAPYPDAGPGSDEDLLSCDAYDVEPAVAGTEIVEIADTVAAPGQIVEVPVLLTNEDAVEGVTLVISYDDEILTPVGLAFEGTPHAGDSRPFFSTATRIADDTLAVGFAVDVTQEASSISPGAAQLIFSILLEVSPEAPVGAILDLAPSDGPGGAGVGPAGIRNEVSRSGTTRFVSTLPSIVPGYLEIVGDLAIFRRGDSNQDDAVDISDAIHTLGFLFLGGGPLACEDAADANDDGRIDVSDPIGTLSALFSGGSRLPPPSRSRGLDPTRDELGCEAPRVEAPRF